jgi:hypothetical protein
MTVGGWHTLGSDVRLLRFRYETNFANQFPEMLAMWVIQCVDAFYRRWATVNIDRHVGVATKTKENQYDGSYECHTKDPIESAEEHLEFKNLCWIERDRVENETYGEQLWILTQLIAETPTARINSRVVQIVGISTPS